MTKREICFYQLVGKRDKVGALSSGGGGASNGGDGGLSSGGGRIVNSGGGWVVMVVH